MSSRNNKNMTKPKTIRLLTIVCFELSDHLQAKSTLNLLQLFLILPVA